MSEPEVDLGPVCPACHEPWLRPTNLPGPLPLRELPHAASSSVGVPRLRRALDHRAHVRHRALRLQQLRELDAPADLMCPELAGVAPSILSADFARLGEQVGEVLDAGARVIHVDVMDGHFVPPITMGPLVVDALAEQVHGAGALLDVHLMIERPERQIAEFAKAGADNITLHAEATPHVHYAIARDQGGGLHGRASRSAPPRRSGRSPRSPRTSTSRSA